MATLREDIAAAMKEAMKAKDQAALATLRLISAALKDRDIAARGNGNQDGIGDDEILSMLQTMIKQRSESAKMYRDGNRPDWLMPKKRKLSSSPGFCLHNLMRPRWQMPSMPRLQPRVPRQSRIWAR
jgi:hypothetical protein